MSQRLFTSAALAVVLISCSSGGTAPTVPGVPTAPPGATQGIPTAPPAGTNQPQNPGDLEARVRALVPPGSTETQEAQVGGMYSLYLTNSTPLDQLEAFWDQTIPGQGLTVTGKFESAGTLTYAFANPNGGLVVTSDGSGGHVIVISLGTSS